jgi:hypothetical protein
MDLGDQFELEHLLFKTRQCRSCGGAKDLLTDFYRIRKDRKSLSAYSYECKDCTVKRVTESRKKKKEKLDLSYDPVPRFRPDIYPDW